jgi:tetratricopeptide (TPR) repeat protein
MQVGFLAPFIQLVQNLIGNSSQQECLAGKNIQNHAILKGEYCDLEATLKEAIETKNDIIIGWCHFLNMFANALFNDYDKANTAGLSLEKSNTKAFPPHNTAYWMLFRGIASISVSKKARVAAKCLKRLKILANYSPFNYCQFVSMLEAEILFQKRMCQAALSKYNDSAMEAKTRGFLCIEALAYERSANVYRHLGRLQEARTALRKSQRTYQTWGAHAKANQILWVLSSQDSIKNLQS